MQDPQPKPGLAAASRPESPAPTLRAVSGLGERATEDRERPATGPIPIRILPPPRINLPDAVLDAPDRPELHRVEAVREEPEPPPPVPIPARAVEPRVVTGRPEPLRIRLPTIAPTDLPSSDEDSQVEPSTSEIFRPDAVFAGRYRIQESLVRSGGLDCYLAIKEPMVRRVVLGVLSSLPDGVDKSAIEARFLQECADLARMQRPELARVYDFGRDANGRCFVVLELIYGLSLREVMNWGPLAESRVATILDHLVRGMAEMHKVGLPVRELRSDQILLEPDREGRERARIASFGLGIVQMVPGGDTDVAPELRDGGEPTRSADVYALGVLMHRALTGRPPGLSEDGDPLASVSPRLASVLRRCLAVPDVRYPTALALLAELESPGPALVAPPPAVVVPAARTNPLLIVALSAAVGALAATLALLYATGRIQIQPEQPVQSTEIRPEEATLVVPPPVEPEAPEPVEVAPVEAAPAVEEAPTPVVVERAPPRAPSRASPQAAPKAPEPVIEPPPETPWTPTEVAPVNPPAPVVEKAPEPVKVEVPPPEPPAKYPAAKALSGLWTGAVDGQSLAMDLRVDGNGGVSGTSRLNVGGTPQNGRVSGLVTPSEGGGWNVELQLQTDSGILTLSGKLEGATMRGRAIQGGANIGKWSAGR